MPPDDRVLASELAAVASKLATLAAQLAEREPPPTPEPRRADRWLSVQQVAERLSRDPRWVYRRARGWAFCRKEGRALLFSERGLERHFSRDDP